MRNVKLREICDVIAGQSPPSSTYNQDGIGTPFFQGKADFGDVFPTVRYWCSEPNKISQPNDILFSLRAPVGPTNINNIEACIGRGIAAIRCKEVDQKYLLHFFRGNEEKIAALGTGSTFKAITIGTLKDLEIPLPPLPTQQKIAAILDEADKLRQLNKQLIAKYDALTQSLFLEMFGDPVTNPKVWQVSDFNKAVESVLGGLSLGGEERPMLEGEIAVLKISAITSGNFRSTEYKVVSPSEINKDLVRPKKGDLIFSRANTREMVGAVAIVDKDYDNLFLPDKLWKLKLKRSLADVYFIKFLLSHDGFRENLRKVATGTSGSMLNISKAKLLKLRVPLPKIEVQNQY